LDRWDELGEYDVPAFINYVLSVTGQAKLVYVGGSLGSSIFFIAMVRHPELNNKIDRMFALTPLSSRRYSQNPFRRAAGIWRFIRVI
jgi:lysosomal acid lipase/cholesteryl ester hydrolase